MPKLKVYREPRPFQRQCSVCCTMQRACKSSVCAATGLLHVMCAPLLCAQPSAVGLQLSPTAVPGATQRHAATRVAGVIWCGLEKGQTPRNAALLTLGDCSSSIINCVEPESSQSGCLRLGAFLLSSSARPVVPNCIRGIPRSVRWALIIASIRWLFRQQERTESRSRLSFLPKLLTHGSIKL